MDDEWGLLDWSLTDWSLMEFIPAVPGCTSMSLSSAVAAMTVRAPSGTARLSSATAVMAIAACE